MARCVPVSPSLSRVFRKGSTCKRIFESKYFVLLFVKRQMPSLRRDRVKETPALSWPKKKSLKNVRVSRVLVRRHFYFECVWREECSGFTYWVQVHQLITEERWSAAARATREELKAWRKMSEAERWSGNMRYKAVSQQLIQNNWTVLRATWPFLEKSRPLLSEVCYKTYNNE